MKLLLRHRLDFSEKELSVLKEHNVEVIDYNPQGDNDADIFVGFVNAPFEELESMEHLKFVQSLKVGYDGIDLQRFKDRNVVFANARGVASNSIAEHVFSRMLRHIKRHDYFSELQDQKIWNRDQKIEELTHKKIIVFGTGHIGQQIAKRAQAFEMEVYGVNSDGRDIEYFDQCYTLDTYQEIISDCDVVVGCLPLNNSTVDLYNESFFKMMKRGSMFMNVGRGDQVVEPDLLKALEDHLGYAYLDVTLEEPLASDSPLWNQDNLELTPHIASWSPVTEERKRELVVDNVLRFIAGKDVKQRVV